MPYKDPTKNREMAIIRARRWAENNRERMREIQRLSKRRSRAKNPEAHAAYAKHWRSVNTLKVREYNKRADHKRHHGSPEMVERRLQSRFNYKQTLKGKQKQRELCAAWRDRNRSMLRLRWKLSAHIRRNLVGNLTQEKWLARLAFYGYLCVYCLDPLTEKTATMDHVIPVIKGGTNWASNIVPACKSCNSRKRIARWLPSWIQHRAIDTHALIRVAE